MIEELQKIQERIDEYEIEYKKVLRQFHDSDSLNYFNDRFGYNNPQAEDADRGIWIEKRLQQMKKDVAEFVERFEEKYPPLE